MRRVLTAGCCLLLASLVLACGGVVVSPEEAARARPVEASATDVEFSLAYAPDADGKWLEITGGVGGVGKDTDGRQFVLMEGTGRHSIKCAFLASQDLAPLQVGMKVTVRGRCTGTSKSLILLEDCILWPAN